MWPPPPQPNLRAPAGRGARFWQLLFSMQHLKFILCAAVISPAKLIVLFKKNLQWHVVQCLLAQDSSLNEFLSSSTQSASLFSCGCLDTPVPSSDVVKDRRLSEKWG